MADIEDCVQREMEKIFGSRGPAHLVAPIPEAGTMEHRRITWLALPSWDSDETVAAAMIAQAPRNLR
ncbi:MAG: hypothetical protein ABIS86_02035 [Streptosporangiaceae bacterium]